MADINVNTDTEINESSAVDSTTENKQETTNTNVGTNETKDTTKDTTETSKTLNLTQEELDKIITKRLDRERQKAESEKQEAEKLAKMSEAERQQTLFDKEKAKFEEERKQYQREKMELEVIKQMSSKGLPTDFAKYLLADNAETALTNIKTFETQWQQALEVEVNKRLKGTTPKSGGSVNTVTKEDFNKMSYMQRQKIYKENIELYKELTK